MQIVICMTVPANARRIRKDGLHALTPGLGQHSLAVETGGLGSVSCGYTPRPFEQNRPVIKVKAIRKTRDVPDHSKTLCEVLRYQHVIEAGPVAPRANP